MDKNIKFQTIRGFYNPSDEEQYLLLDHSGLPDLALICEPVKNYNDDYKGILFYKRVKNTTLSHPEPSQKGGSSIPESGFSRSEGI